MCRWLAYKGGPIYLEELISEPSHSLIDQSIHATEGKTPTNGDGFGIGWYGQRETPGVYREVLPAWNDRNIKSLAHQISSSLFFAHVRASTGTETTRPNCHPFAHGRWLFMHNGQVGGYEQIRRSLEALIPDNSYSSRTGTTDSEALFLMMLADGLDRDPQGALQATLQKTEAVMAAAGIKSALRFTAALSDGTNIYAARYASDDKPPTLYYSADADRTIVVSEPLEEQGRIWQPVPKNHLLTIDAQGGTEVTALH